VKGNSQLILSRGILEELAEVAANDKIRKYAKEEDVEKFFQIIKDAADTPSQFFQ
jgi:hypothetical protein